MPPGCRANGGTDNASGLSGFAPSRPAGPGWKPGEGGGAGPSEPQPGASCPPFLVCSHPWAGPPRGPNPLEPSRILAQLAHPLPRSSVEKALLRVTRVVTHRPAEAAKARKCEESGCVLGRSRASSEARPTAGRGEPARSSQGPGQPGCSSSSEPPPQGSRRPRFSSSICEAALSHPRPVSQGREPNIAPSYWRAERSAQVLFNSTHNCEAGTRCPSYKRRDRASEGTPPTAAPPPRELCSGRGRASGHSSKGAPALESASTPAIGPTGLKDREKAHF
nr:uncharacterized protein LOC112934521 [Vulpes vulpes]